MTEKDIVKHRGRWSEGRVVKIDREREREREREKERWSELNGNYNHRGR